MSLALELTIFNKLLAAVAEEMGIVRRRRGFSFNIKERRDSCCVLGTAQGELLAQATHIPGHLGALPRTLARVLPGYPLAPGENVPITAKGEEKLPGKANLALPAGSRLSIRTPGGGGWGLIAGENREKTKRGKVKG